MKFVGLVLVVFVGNLAALGHPLAASLLVNAIL